MSFASVACGKKGGADDADDDDAFDAFIVTPPSSFSSPSFSEESTVMINENYVPR